MLTDEEKQELKELAGSAVTSQQSGPSVIPRIGTHPGRCVFLLYLIILRISKLCLKKFFRIWLLSHALVRV